jgi:hypothetical protein
VRHLQRGCPCDPCDCVVWLPLNVQTCSVLSTGMASCICMGVCRVRPLACRPSMRDCPCNPQSDVPFQQLQQPPGSTAVRCVGWLALHGGLAVKPPPPAIDIASYACHVPMGLCQHASMHAFGFVCTPVRLYVCLSTMRDRTFQGLGEGGKGVSGLRSRTHQFRILVDSATLQPELLHIHSNSRLYQ